MRTVNAGLLVAGLAFVAAPVLAVSPGLEPASVTLRSLGSVELPQGTPPAALDGPRFGAEAVTPGELIAIGNGIWKLIKGSVAVKAPPSASVLPKGATGWADTTGWSPLKGEKYRLTAKNRSGITFVDTTFTVARRYGGSYQGKGKYLTEVQIMDIKAWAWPTVNLNMECSVGEPFNAGTVKDPVAGLRLQVKVDSESTMSDFEKSWNVAFEVTGDGRMQQTGGDPLGAEPMRMAGAVDDAINCWGNGGKGGCTSAAN